MAKRRSNRRVQLGIRIGSIVRIGREGLRWTKIDLSERSGISRQMIAAVESGHANPSLNVVAALLDGLDIDIDIVSRGRVVLGNPQPGDAAHAIGSAYVQRRLEAAGWEVAREVRIEDGRYVGWIDLLAFHEPTGILLVIEVKTRVDDVGAIERSIDWHLRGASRVAARLGWQARRVAGRLLCLATDEVDQELYRNRTLWASAFPIRAPEMSGFLAMPRDEVLDRGLALMDPRSRGRGWLIRTRADGRRSAPPYRGYADFMTQVRGGKRR